MEINDITGIIINEAIKIHTDLGPGLLESLYEEILAYRLKERNLQVRRQVPIPVFYEKVKMDVGFRADMIVNDTVILEIKSIETLLPVHFKQLLTYLKITDKRIGLLINFNEALLKNGIKRIANKYNSAAPATLRENL